MSKAKRDLDIGNSLPVALNKYRNSNLCPSESSPKYDRSWEAWENHLTTQRSLWTHFVRRASSHIEWATPAVRLYKCWEKSRPRRGDFVVWTARQNTHWTRFELISNEAASEIRLQSNKPLDNCRLFSKRREGRGLWGRGRGFDMGSITVPDRSLQRQKKPSVTLVFCKLRPSFSLSRQRSRVRAPSSPPHIPKDLWAVWRSPRRCRKAQPLPRKREYMLLSAYI